MFRTPDGYQVSDSIKFKSVLVPELTKIHWDELPPVDALHLKSVVDGLFDKIRSGEISETIPVYDVSRSPISRLESMAAPRMLDIPHVRISRISPFPASTLQTIPEDLKNKLVRILDDCGGGSEIRMAAEQLRSGALGITQFIDSMQAVLFKNPDQFSAVMDALNSGRWAPGSGDSSHPMDIIKNQLMATVLYANLSHMEQVSEGVRGEVDGLTSRTIPEPIVRMLSGAFPNIPEINTAYIGRPIPTISRDPWGLKLPEQLLLDVSSDDPSVRAKAIGIIHHEARHLQQFFEMTQYLFEKIRSEESHGTASAKLRK
ncbi:hypothetical protein EBR96_05995, partial [bacterium]|nr:hypothetical protein [bacterium]